jgi:hypothetical protein
MLVPRDFAAGVKRLRKRWVDGGSQAQWPDAWGQRRKQTHQRALDVGELTGPGLQVVQHRGKVERTVAIVGTMSG